MQLADSLALAMSLPTMAVGFAHYTRSNAFAVLGQERLLLSPIAVGSILGTSLGGLLVGLVSGGP